MSTKELATQNTNLPAQAPAQRSEQVLSSDVVIPKLHLLQALSEVVVEKKAEAGQMVRSTTKELLGDENTPVELIPLTFQNLWMLSEGFVNPKTKEVKYEFRGYEPRTHLNERLDWDYELNGSPWRRTKVMNVFALLPADIQAQANELKKFEETGEMPDLDKALLPIVISFKNMSFKAGKDIATLFAKAESISQQIGKPVPVYGQTLKLCCKLEQNEKGSFYVFHTEPAGKTKEEFKAAAQSWYTTLASMAANIKIDDSEEVGAVKEEAAESAGF